MLWLILMANGTMSRLLNRREAADYLGMKTQTLAAWAITGKYGLPFVKVGRAVRYRQQDLDHLIATHMVGTPHLEEVSNG